MEATRFLTHHVTVQTKNNILYVAQMEKTSPLKPAEIRRAKGLIAKYEKYRDLISNYQPLSAEVVSNTIPLETIDSQETTQTNDRSTIADYMPFSNYPAGTNSFPGPDITFTPPPSNSAVVNLGCLANSGNTESFSITWPSQQTPANFATGSGQQRYRVVQNHPLTVVQPQTNLFTAAATSYGNLPTETLNTPAAVPSSTIPNDGQPSTQTYIDPSPSRNDISNVLLGGVSNPFQGSISTGTAGFINSISNGYSSIGLAQEGLLWTLWPLAKPKYKGGSEIPDQDPYFNGFRFGTAKTSQYQIGQLGYFYNNLNMGCIPIASSTANASLVFPNIRGIEQNGLEILLLSILSATHNTPGVQGFNETLTISTAQLLSLLVVKVCEEVARIPNPVAGASSDERFFYVGYDGWAVIRTSNSPIGPMAAQTYVTPQSITGSVVSENFQVIIPPNFPSTVYYKNTDIRPPVATQDGLIPIIPCRGIGPPYGAFCNVSYFNHNFDPNSGPPPPPLTQNPVTFQGPPPGVTPAEFNQIGLESLLAQAGVAP